MNLFTLIEKDEIHFAPDTKIIPAEQFSQIVDATQIVEKVKEEATQYRLLVAKECETLKERGEEAGFESGLHMWHSQLALLEEEIRNVREEMENAIVPLALTAVNKILGKELEIRHDAIVDLVATALKAVVHHRRITLYVSPYDLEHLEAKKARLRALFDRLESLTIMPRADISPGGCVIETEAGIINAKLENQLAALEAAFKTFFQNRRQKKGKKGREASNGENG